MFSRFSRAAARAAPIYEAACKGEVIASWMRGRGGLDGWSVPLWLPVAQLDVPIDEQAGMGEMARSHNSWHCIPHPAAYRGRFLGKSLSERGRKAPARGSAPLPTTPASTQPTTCKKPTCISHPMSDHKGNKSSFICRSTALALQIIRSWWLLWKVLYLPGRA